MSWVGFTSSSDWSCAVSIDEFNYSWLDMKRFWHLFIALSIWKKYLNLYGRVLEGSEKRCFRSWRLWWEYEFGILVDWCRIMNLICSMIRSIAILCFLILIHTPIRRMKYGWGSHFDLTRSCLFCSLFSIRRAKSIPPRENANPQSFRRKYFTIFKIHD